MKQIIDLVRPAIRKALSAGSNHNDSVVDSRPKVSMHLNENPFGTPQNRYANLSELHSREVIGQLKGGLRPQCISLSRGTADAIERLMRTFCMQGQDNIIVVQPTVDIYAHVARVNDIEVRDVQMDEQFRLDVDAVLDAVDSKTKMIILSSPNNPTGNLQQPESILQLCNQFEGIVVVDEAFVEFSRNESLVRNISSCPNLVVVESLSVAYALASSRIAVILAHPQVIRAVEVLRYAFSLDASTAEIIESLPRRRFDADKWVKALLDERTKLLAAIAQLPICDKVYPTSANFFMVRFKGAAKVYQYLLSNGIAVYDCSHIPGCEDCLRITVGLPVDNTAIVSALRQYGESLR